MWRWLRRIAFGSSLLLVGAGAALALLYRAATAPVPEYRALVEQIERLDAAELEQNRKQLESQLAAFYSDAANEPTWQTVVTARQINSWLATELDGTLPELAEQGILQPRVLIDTRAITLAMRASLRGLDTVVSLDLAPAVAEGGDLALELAAARVGSASLPTAQLLAQLRAAAGDEGLPGRWMQNDGRPVLVIDMSWAGPAAGPRATLEVIELREGEVYVSGRTAEATPRVASLDD